jgi:hypothetical protein
MRDLSGWIHAHDGIKGSIEQLLKTAGKYLSSFLAIHISTLSPLKGSELAGLGYLALTNKTATWFGAMAAASLVP